MRLKPIYILLAMVCFSFAAVAQVDITAKKVTYKRTGANVPDFKKTFEVTYPVISGVGDEKIKQRIKRTIDYWKAFETTLEENLDDYHWLTRLDFKVNYNRNGVLDIMLIMEGAGAYPDGFTKNLVVNIHTGNRIMIPDAFSDVGALLLLVDKAQKKEIDEAVADLKKERPDDAATLHEMVSRSEYAIKRLDEYSVSDKGVTFIFDYGFPHAIAALEPVGRYFFSWERIGEFLSRNGPLKVFAKKRCPAVTK